MDIEILRLAGFALMATALARMAYERRLDVLYGPYILGRARGRVGLFVKRRRKSVQTALDRFRSLECLREHQLASTAS